MIPNVLKKQHGYWLIYDRKKGRHLDCLEMSNVDHSNLKSLHQFRIRSKGLRYSLTYQFRLQQQFLWLIECAVQIKQRQVFFFGYSTYEAKYASGCVGNSASAIHRDSSYRRET